MEEKREHLCDKSTWLPGPWQDEPDRVEWRSPSGLACLIVRNNFGALCGYVGVGPDHPLHGKEYGEVDLRAHGGLTFSAPCQEDGKICHIPEPGEPDAVWWFGFDCAHSGDFWEVTYGPQHPMVLKAPHLFGADIRRRSGDVYRDIEYVKAEVNSLATQIEEGWSARTLTGPLNTPWAKPSL